VVARHLSVGALVEYLSSAQKRRMQKQQQKLSKRKACYLLNSRLSISNKELTAGIQFITERLASRTNE
jgi:hypothetical protein